MFTNVDEFEGFTNFSEYDQAVFNAGYEAAIEDMGVNFRYVEDLEKEAKELEKYDPAAAAEKWKVINGLKKHVTTEDDRLNKKIKMNKGKPSIRTIC